MSRLAVLLLVVSQAVWETRETHAESRGHSHNVTDLNLLSLDSECSRAKSESSCLVDGSQCMWLRLSTGPKCLPCRFGEVDFPCATKGSFFGGAKVEDCRMMCKHQKTISKVSPCVDISGTVTMSQCFSKGISVGANCMWTQFLTPEKETKAVCGPCQVEGIGQIPCVTPGMMGPEDGSTAIDCTSQCDGACPGSPMCTITQPPPAPPLEPWSMKTLGIVTAPNAPDYFAVPVPAPYGIRQYTEAAAVAAGSAGWPAGITLPPDAPVVIFGPPPFEGPTLPPALKMTLGPAPPGLPGIPPPGFGMGTIPPRAWAEEALKAKQDGKASLLSVSRRGGRVAAHYP
mmetsp:Transcript_32998/g.72093  ORF Transcript_32998/g.72093 Transcript_32998/m.72093 type:complete len:343 (-) Transcript_32998:38-1066(-)